MNASRYGFIGLVWMLAVTACTSTAPQEVSVLPQMVVGTTYYVNNKSGSNCSNGAAGSSSAQPWCDFTPVNARTFQPGDTILLARGATWYQKMDLKGSGTSSAWITVDAYGSGARPIIRGNDNATDRTILMRDSPSYWTVQNLELSHAGDGIRVNFTSPGHEGLRFRNLYIHDINAIVEGSPGQSDYGIYWSTAITLGSNGFNPGTGYVVRDVVIENVETAFTTPISFQGPNYDNILGCGDPPSAQPDITIRNNYFHDAIGNLSFQCTSNLRFISNRMERMGTRNKSSGTTGIFLWRSQNVTVANNILAGTPSTGSPDMTAIDYEGYLYTINTWGNLITGNAGSGLEFLALNGRPNDFNLSHDVAGNTFVNNNTSGSGTYRSSLLYINENGASMTGTVRDNLYAEPSGFTQTNSGSQNMGFTNNRAVAAGDVYHAAGGFSGVQGNNGWSYQFFNGSSYNNISPYDTASEHWGAGGYVSRFDLLPDSCGSCWIARVWTAPKAGTVSLRGRAFKNDLSGGDGVQVRISKNSSAIYNARNLAYNDGSGVDTNLDGVTVAAGDVLRFEVNANSNASGDLTSWTPVVAYTASSGGSGTKVDDRSAQIAYSSGWSQISNSAYYAATSTFSTSANAQFQYGFSGSSIAWYGVLGNDHGKADVYIDNNFDATVDMYAPNRSVQAVYAKTGLSSGNHTLKVVVRSDRNASSSNNYVEVDALETGGTVTPPAPNATKLDDRSGALSYTGGWSQIGGANYYSNTSTFTTVSGQSVQLSFTGSSVRWYGVVGSDHGKAEVFIDGVYDATVDCYAPNWAAQSVYFKSGLSSGNHTLGIIVRSDRNPSATNNYVEVDALEYQ